MRTTVIIVFAVVAIWQAWKAVQAKKNPLGMKTTRMWLQFNPLYDEEVHSFKGTNGKYGLMSANGSIIVEPKYTCPVEFLGDFAVVYTGGTVTEKVTHPGNGFRFFDTIITGATCSILMKDGIEIISNYIWIERMGENYFGLYTNAEQFYPSKFIKLIRYKDYVEMIENFDYLCIEDGAQEFVPDHRVYKTRLGFDIPSYSRSPMLIKSMSNLPAYFAFLINYPETAIVMSFMFKLNSLDDGYCYDELIEEHEDDIDAETVLATLEAHGFQDFENREELEAFLEDLEYFEFPELPVTIYDSKYSGYGWDYVYYGKDEPLWAAFFNARP